MGDGSILWMIDEANFNNYVSMGLFSQKLR